MTLPQHTGETTSADEAGQPFPGDLRVATQASRGDLSLQLLGGFALVKDGDRVKLSQPAERVMAFLGLHETRLARAYVSGKLWGSVSDERAGARLRTALWRLRTVDPTLVASDRSRVGLGPEVTVDAREMVRSAHEVLSGKTESDGFDPSRYRNDLLPDWYDEWVLVEQAQLHELRLEALEAIALRSLERNDHGTAIRAALVVTGAEPLRESAHRLAIRAHLANGNRYEALRQFDTYASLLRHELGVLPSSAIAELVDELRTDDS